MCFHRGMRKIIFELSLIPLLMWGPGVLDRVYIWLKRSECLKYELRRARCTLCVCGKTFSYQSWAFWPVFCLWIILGTFLVYAGSEGSDQVARMRWLV